MPTLRQSSRLTTSEIEIGLPRHQELAQDLAVEEGEAEEAAAEVEAGVGEERSWGRWMILEDRNARAVVEVGHGILGARCVTLHCCDGKGIMVTRL